MLLYFCPGGISCRCRRGLSCDLAGIAAGEAPVREKGRRGGNIERKCLFHFPGTVNCQEIKLFFFVTVIPSITQNFIAMNTRNILTAIIFSAVTTLSFAKNDPDSLGLEGDNLDLQGVL